MCDVELLVYPGENVINCGVGQTFWEAPLTGIPKGGLHRFVVNLQKWWWDALAFSSKLICSVNCFLLR
jgi:hypothetical protein